MGPQVGKVRGALPAATMADALRAVAAVQRNEMHPGRGAALKPGLLLVTAESKDVIVTSTTSR